MNEDPGRPVPYDIVERAGMSVGANVEEAQAGESGPDSLHKMRIARKKCRGSRYFLRRIANAELIAPSRLNGLIDEADQLVRILTARICNKGKAGRAVETLSARKSLVHTSGDRNTRCAIS